MIILDTHVWLWWINRDENSLKPAWVKMIEQVDNVGVSAISCFEVAWLAGHGRITIDLTLGEWFAKALAGSDITLVPLTPEVAERAVALPEHHSDPQDRIIIATALIHEAHLLSADSKFLLYRELGDKLVC